MTNLRNFGRTKYLLHIGGIIALALSFSCGSGGGGKNGANASNANKDDGSKTPPIAITVGKSESREVASTIQATGSLIADETSDIAPKVDVRGEDRHPVSPPRSSGHTQVWCPRCTVDFLSVPTGGDSCRAASCGTSEGSCFTALRQGKPWSYLRSTG